MSKRKRILVDPEVQWAVVARIMLHWMVLLVCLITIGAMVYILAGTNGSSFGEAFWSAVKSQRAVAGVMFVLVPVFIRDTMKLSNRFAGPMFRIRTELKRMAAGETHRPIAFRQGDFWLEAAADFNVVAKEIESLKTRNQELETELADLRKQAVS